MRFPLRTSFPLKNGVSLRNSVPLGMLVPLKTSFRLRTSVALRWVSLWERVSLRERVFPVRISVPLRFTVSTRLPHCAARSHVYHQCETLLVTMRHNRSPIRYELSTSFCYSAVCVACFLLMQLTVAASSNRIVVQETWSWRCCTWAFCYISSKVYSVLRLHVCVWGGVCGGRYI